LSALYFIAAKKKTLSFEYQNEGDVFLLRHPLKYYSTWGAIFKLKCQSLMFS